MCVRAVEWSLNFFTSISILMDVIENSNSWTIAFVFGLFWIVI